MNNKAGFMIRSPEQGAVRGGSSFFRKDDDFFTKCESSIPSC